MSRSRRLQDFPSGRLCKASVVCYSALSSLLLPLASWAQGTTGIPVVPSTPRAETSNTTILPTDVVPLAGGQERSDFAENLQLRIMQRLPASFYFSSSFEMTERYETNPFQFPKKRQLIRQLPPPPIIRQLDVFQQARLNDFIGLANNDDLVFRLLPNVSGGFTVTPRTRLFCNYFMIRDQLAHNVRLNTIIHSLGAGLQQDFPITSRGNLQLELQARELWQLHQQSVFDFLPGLTFSYVVNPRTVAFANALIQARGKAFFQAPTKEIDPFYTWGLLHQRNGWTFSASTTFVQNFREPFRGNATIPVNNYVFICDFEVSRRILRRLPGLQAFCRIEPIYNFHSNNTPGLAGMDFRAFFGMRFAMAKPALTASIRNIRQQLEETETIKPQQKPQPEPSKPKPSAFQLQPHELAAHNPQPIHGFLAKGGDEETALLPESELPAIASTEVQGIAPDSGNETLPDEIVSSSQTQMQERDEIGTGNLPSAGAGTDELPIHNRKLQLPAPHAVLSEMPREPAPPPQIQLAALAGSRPQFLPITALQIAKSAPQLSAHTPQIVPAEAVCPPAPASVQAKARMVMPRLSGTPQHTFPQSMMPEPKTRSDCQKITPTAWINPTASRTAPVPQPLLDPTPAVRSKGPEPVTVAAPSVKPGCPAPATSGFTTLNITASIAPKLPAAALPRPVLPQMPSKAPAVPERVDLQTGKAAPVPKLNALAVLPQHPPELHHSRNGQRAAVFSPPQPSSLAIREPKAIPQPQRAGSTINSPELEIRSAAVAPAPPSSVHPAPSRLAMAGVPRMLHIEVNRKETIAPPGAETHFDRDSNMPNKANQTHNSLSRPPAPQAMANAFRQPSVSLPALPPRQEHFPASSSDFLLSGAVGINSPEQILAHMSNVFLAVVDDPCTREQSTSDSSNVPVLWLAPSVKELTAGVPTAPSRSSKQQAGPPTNMKLIPPLPAINSDSKKSPLKGSGVVIKTPMIRSR